VGILRDKDAAGSSGRWRRSRIVSSSSRRRVRAPPRSRRFARWCPRRPGASRSPARRATRLALSARIATSPIVCVAARSRSSGTSCATSPEAINPARSNEGPRAWGSFFHDAIRASILLLAAPSWLTAWPPLRRRRPPTTVLTTGGEVTVVAAGSSRSAPTTSWWRAATPSCEGVGPFARRPHRDQPRDRRRDRAGPGDLLRRRGPAHRTADRLQHQDRDRRGVRGEARATPYYRIMGERLERLGESVYRVRRGVFTTCDDDSPSWSFRVGLGTADLQDLRLRHQRLLLAEGRAADPVLPVFARPSVASVRRASWRRSSAPLAQGSLRRDPVLLGDHRHQDAT